MTHVRGIKVTLETHSDADSGTNDMIYIGVVGSGGGREFPLASPEINDFETGTDITYVLGTIHESVPSGSQVPVFAAPGQQNDPAGFRMELSDVDHVYIRKQGDRSFREDNAYQLDSVVVELYARQIDTPDKRTFRASNNLWLGNEFGAQAWLHE